MRAALNPWRQSSSLIVVAKTCFTPTPTPSKKFNYKLLSMVRSSKSGFMPNTHVFPGGALSDADTTRDWLALFEKFGFKEEAFEKLRCHENRTLILQDLDDGDRSDQKLPQFLALRIGAIRETFEECGILICRSFKVNYKERIAKWASFIEGPEIVKWQDRVHDDPQMFLELCRKFEVYPDVWALKEWSNWVTPSTFKRRFDTIFFLAAFNQTPPIFAEKHEVEHVEWNVPMDFITRSKQGEIALPPPQFYEISRLSNFTDIERLQKFASDRASQGLERFLPVQYKTSDEFYSLLPGDDLYPKKDYEESDEPTEVEKLADCDVLHRVRHRSPYDHEILLKNYRPKCGHIEPLVFKANDSKL